MKNRPRDSEIQRFRNSQKEDILKTYLIIKNNILNHFKVIGKSFNKSDIESF